MKENRSDGSEIHRLRPMQSGYDVKVFNRLFKICKPVIRNLTRQIDVRRFNITKDILGSQFQDKMLFVFNKYYGTVNEEHLKANILRALSTYKVHLLKYAYNEKAEFNQNLHSLEDLYDNSKELLDDMDEAKAKEEMIDMVNAYMKKNLSEDAYLVWEVVNNPPPYIENKARGSRITNILIAEFFNLPKTRKAVKYIGELREDISYWISQASKDLHY